MKAYFIDRKHIFYVCGLIFFLGLFNGFLPIVFGNGSGSYESLSELFSFTKIVFDNPMIKLAFFVIIAIFLIGHRAKIKKEIFSSVALQFGKGAVFASIAFTLLSVSGLWKSYAQTTGEYKQVVFEEGFTEVKKVHGVETYSRTNPVYYLLSENNEKTLISANEFQAYADTFGVGSKETNHKANLSKASILAQEGHIWTIDLKPSTLSSGILVSSN